MNKAFDKKIPSLFVISTPFQALCAVEAIREFEISDFHITVLVFGEDIRLTQTRKVLEFFDLNYEVLQMRNSASFLLFPFIGAIEHKYERVFLGDFYVPDILLYALQHIKNRSCVIYLDDGNSTVSVFNNLQPAINDFVMRTKRCYASFLSTCKCVNLNGLNFYTVYSDLAPVGVESFKNTLSHLVPIYRERNSLGRKVLFVGSNGDGLCEVFHLSREQYHNVLFNQLLKIQSKGLDVEYIPHGKDRDEEINIFCVQNGIFYNKIDVCIELFLLTNKTDIESVYGFSSSALLNIKMLFPNTEIYNLNINAKTASLDYAETAKYYGKQGIINLSVDI